MRFQGFRWASSLAAVLVAAAIPAQATEALGTPSEPPPVPIEVPPYAIAPDTAAIVSGLTLLGGAIGGTILLAHASDNSAGGVPQWSSWAVMAGTLVFAPSLGRWVGGDVETAAARTGTRFLLVGAASIAFYDIGGGPRPLSIAIFGLLASVIVTHAVSDVAATSRDLSLGRAVRAVTVSRTAQGAPVVSLAGHF